MRKIAAALILALGVAAAPALAETSQGIAKGDVLLRVRAIGVIPRDKSGSVVPAFPGEHVVVSNSFVPEVDVTYMATDNIGFELIAATTKHHVSGKSGTTGTIGKLLSSYVLPPTLASQLTTITFHVIGVASIITIGMQLATPAVGWALAALYCSSAYVLGVGGGSETIGGITFISHIAPPAVSMLAFAFLARPFIAGFMLVAASMTVFFPALFFPAWLGYYWDRRPSMIKFIGGCVLGAAVFVLPTIALSQALPDHSVVSTVLKESVGHHQGTDTYGLSTFGFWGQRGGIRDWFREPFIEGQFTTSPMFLITIGFAAVMFFMARHTRRWQLALITATVGIIAQWSKIHGTGVYVNWYYPFLLIGLLAARPSPPALPVEHGDDGAGALGAAQHAN